MIGRTELYESLVVDGGQEQRRTFELHRGAFCLVARRESRAWEEGIPEEIEKTLGWGEEIVQSVRTGAMVRVFLVEGKRTQPLSFFRDRRDFRRYLRRELQGRIFAAAASTS